MASPWNTETLLGLSGNLFHLSSRCILEHFLIFRIPFIPASNTGTAVISTHTAVARSSLTSTFLRRLTASSSSGRTNSSLGLGTSTETSLTRVKSSPLSSGSSHTQNSGKEKKHPKKIAKQSHRLNFLSSSLTFKADIALLELAQSVRFDEFKQPAALARPSLSVADLRFNVTGWGTLKERGEYSNKLRQAQVPYVPYDVCKKSYKDLSIAARILPGMICAGTGRIFTCD